MSSNTHVIVKPVDETRVITKNKGIAGKSAYQLALDSGFIGSFEEWRLSLVGPKGDQGIRGEEGPQGERGFIGLQGPQGLQGPRGFTGPKGERGLVGPQGLQGLKGDQGLQGIQGVKGDKGDQGNTGGIGIGLQYEWQGSFLGIKREDEFVFDFTNLKGDKGEKTEYIGGSGIVITGDTISNGAPDQTVTLAGSGSVSITGSYPNFTVAGVDTNTTYTAGDGLTLAGTVFSFEPDLLTKLNGIQAGATKGFSRTKSSVSKELTAFEHCVFLTTATATLPNVVANTDEVIIAVGDFDTLTIQGNGANIMGSNEPLLVNIKNASVHLRYINSTIGWVIV